MVKNRETVSQAMERLCKRARLEGMELPAFLKKANTQAVAPKRMASAPQTTGK